MRSKIKFYPVICLITGLIFIGAGVFLLADGDFIITVISYGGGLLVTLHGITIGVSAISRKKELAPDAFSSLIASCLFNLCVGGVMLLLPMLQMVPVYIVFTVYIIINALIKLVDYVIDVRDNVQGRLYELMMFLFFAVFGVLMACVPGMGAAALYIVSGIYCIIYGAFLLWDGVLQLLPVRIRSKITRRLTLPMPVLVSSWRPIVKLKSRHRQTILDPDGVKAELKPYFPEGKETNAPPDMEVMIHVSETGFGIMGHCDLSFEGEVLSYGSYDLASTSLFGCVGDGIFVVAPRESYIRFYVTSTPREIYGYGFRLNEAQKQAVREEIKTLKSMAYPWETPLQQVLHSDPDAKGEVVMDWGSKMWNCTGADFFKFKSGKMKTYFVLTSNCVKMTDMIVRKACTDIIPPRNVFTPGSYYDYLEHLLAMNDSPVICRTVYDRVSTTGWKYTPRHPYSSPQLEMRSETEANRLASEKQGRKFEKKQRKEHKKEKKKEEKRE